MTTPVEHVSIFDRWIDVEVVIDLVSVPETPPDGPMLEDRPVDQSVDRPQARQ